jgi:hypothetical protein
MAVKTIEVIASKKSTTKFTITAASRPEAEQAIADRLRSDKELIWEDSPEGINAACISGSDVWRPRRRFFHNEDNGSE